MPLISKPNLNFEPVLYTGAIPKASVTGSAQILTAQSKFGGSSAYFNGTSDNIYMADSTDFAFGSGNFTIEFWMYPTLVTGSADIVGKRATSSSYGPFLIYRSTTSVQLYMSSNGTSWDIASAVAIGTVAANNWYHIAVTRSGTSIRTFFNGALVSTATSSATAFVNTSAVYIGGLSAAFYAGYVDDLRIYKGVAKYTATFTAPTAAIPLDANDPNWSSCVLAMPMDSVNASTVFPAFSYANASTQTVTGLNFQPDLVWIKGRSGATDHAIYDSVRGVTKDLGSNTVLDEATYSFGLTSFNSNGFTVGALPKISTSAATYVAWCWRKGVTQGLDILTYTGTGVSGRTVAHSLGVAPSFMLFKPRTTAGADTGWPVYHSSLANTDYLVLSSNAAKTTSAAAWNNVSPTATTITLGNGGGVNTLNDPYVAYCWSAVPGFSSFGSYTGNGNADGPFIVLGFKPALVIIKCSSTTGSWVMLDNERLGYNVGNRALWADLTTAEGSADLVDFVSGGFKIRSTDASINTSAATYVYAAWAESPFKYTTGR